MPQSAARRSPFPASSPRSARAAGPDPSKLRGKTTGLLELAALHRREGASPPVLDQFSKKYGVKVKYIEDINDNASFFGKIQAQLRRDQSIGRDLIVMTDNSPYPALLVKNKWVEKLDKNVIPNVKNLVPGAPPSSVGPEPRLQHAVESGLDGIGYNAKLTKPVTTVDQLFTDKRLKGKVTLLNEMADTMTPRHALERRRPGEGRPTRRFDRALTKIQKAVKSGQIRQFTGNDYSGLLAKGDVWAAFVWSGDMVQLHADNKYLQFVIPKSGGMLWTDNMLIPKHGDPYLASVYMNFVYDPKIAAKIDDYVNYICPVIGAKQVLLKTDPAAARNPLIFPTPAMLKQAAPVRPERALQRGLQAEVAEASRGLGPSAGRVQAGSLLHRNRWADPVPPARSRPRLPRALLPRPAGLPRPPVAGDPEPDRLHELVHLGLAQLLGRAHHLRLAARPLVRVRGDRDRDRAPRSATRSRTASRSRRAAGRTSSCC